MIVPAPAGGDIRKRLNEKSRDIPVRSGTSGISDNVSHTHHLLQVFFYDTGRVCFVSAGGRKMLLNKLYSMVYSEL